MSLRTFFRLLAPPALVACTVSALYADPTPPMRMIAEWEPAAGTLIRWPLGIPSSLVVELAEDDSLYVLVETQGQEDSARNTFQTWGVVMEHVRFIRTNTYSHWTRDWGPQDVFDGNGVWGIADPWFNGYPWVPGCNNGPGSPRAAASDVSEPSQDGRVSRGGTRGWEEDDVVNIAVANDFGAPLHPVPAFCVGGNIMVDGLGTAFSTQQMLNENASNWSEPEFRDIMETWLGISNYHFLASPETFGIQHIDCYAKLLDEETVLIKKVSFNNPEYFCVENMVNEFAALTNAYGRPYTIVRVQCGAYSGWDVAAYTNSLILNRKVFVPLFGVATDEAALQTYRDAMPGYEVIGFPYGSWYYYDALHCRTMAIFDRHMLRLSHRRMDAIVSYAPEHLVTAEIDDRSEAGLVTDALLVRWRLDGDTVWNDVPLLATDKSDSFTAAIPGLPPGSIVEYYLTATDLTGRTETLPRTAPEGTYHFAIDNTTGVPGVTAETYATELSLAPNPFRTQTGIRFDLPADGHVSLSVHDGAGRRVRILHEGAMTAGRRQVTWDGRDQMGQPCAPGLYFVRLQSGERTSGTRCLLLR